MKLFDRYAKRYDQWYERHPAAFFSEVAAIKKALPKNKNGLEIGAGTGRFAAALGIQTGIDPSSKMIQLAHSKGVDLRLGSGEKLPFADQTFDYVAIIVTLCFVRDPRKVLLEAARVLKKRGKIILGLIDKNSFLGQAYRVKESVFYRQAHFYTVPEAKSLLYQAGFRNFACYQTIFSWPDKISALERPRQGYGKGGFVVVSAKK